MGVALSVALSAANGVSAATISVTAGGNLQAAIDAAQPGDTILLQAGATFSGPYKLPAKGGSRYITIRSSAADSQLPGAGERMDPSYASLLPKIRSTTAGPAMRTAAGASYWRLMFLEFLPSSSTSNANLVEFGATGSSQSTYAAVPHHLMMDRCYLHGDPGYGQRRGLALNSGEAQILNSYFADFKMVNQDTQAIMGWNGPGPFLIENNYIEAAAENIMFGGSDPSIPNLIPSDIIIRRNLITKKTAWMTQSWTVKNLIELKNGQRVYIEGNTIENNWAAGQQGYSIVFTPRNQSGTAPWTVVRDIFVQNNIIRHVAAGFNINGYDNLATSQQTQNITIKNNLLYDVNTRWSIPNHPANGWLTVIGGGPKNITIDHNTVDNNGSSAIFIYGGYSRTGTSIAGLEITNNLLRDNSYGIYGDKYGEGNVGLKAYAPNAQVLRNTFAGGQAQLYPTGNDFPSLAAWLADFVNAGAGNYRLVSTSLSRRTGTDGKDLGVDFAALDAAIPPPCRPVTATLAADRSAPLLVGASINFTATTNCGTAGLQYKWWLYDGAAWISQSDWTVSRTFAWRPTLANPAYRIGVWVRSNGGSGPEAFADMPFPITSNKVTGVTVTADLPSPQAGGTRITWTATAAGGTAPLQYQWWVFDGSDWIARGDWTASNTFVWTPTVANPNYQVGVWVRSSGGSAPEAMAAAPFAIVTLSAGLTGTGTGFSGHGTPVTLTVADIESATFKHPSATLRPYVRELFASTLGPTEGLLAFRTADVSQASPARRATCGVILS